MRFCLSLVVLASSLVASAETLLELPVSATNNALWISSMTERPWWNEAWTKRVPLLVAGQADENDDQVVVNAIVDFGEPVRPEDVRVVTPWETLVDCVCEKVEVEGGGGQRTSDSLSRGEDAPATRGKGVPALAEKNGTHHCPPPPPPSTSTSLRLLFKTTLRPHQNKPFLVYFGYNGERTLLSVQKGANGQECPFSALPDVRLAETADAFRIDNGVLDVVFDRRHAAAGLIRSIHVHGSPRGTPLFERANGYAKAGFVFEPNAKNGWDKGTVVIDTALAKSVRFTCEAATVTFTMYADQPRIDWTYRLAKGHPNATIRMNWTPGGDSSSDDFFYCGKSGAILTQRGALDYMTDCVKPPSGRFEKWIGEGWYAFGDHKTSDFGGLVFDVTGVNYLGYDSYYGENATLTLAHRLKKDECAVGSGAVVALRGTVHDFRRVYRRIAKPVAVSVGAVQGKVDKPYRLPRFDRDWCADYNVGWSFGGDNGTAEPLMKDPDWARTVVNRLRSYGSTVACVMGYPWTMMPVEKDLYDRLMALKDCGGWEDWIPKRTWPTWDEMKGAGAELRAFTDAIHAKGMGVHTWCGFVPGWSVKNDGKFMKPINDIGVEFMSLRVKCGQDCAYANALEGEGVALPSDLVKKNGSSSYWAWKNPQEAFDAFDRQHVLMREFYTQFKAKHPDVPVFLWNSENGEYEREKFMSEDEGFFDTMVVEICPRAGLPHTKHAAKRMRSHFNNRVGHTVWHHYYIMAPRTRERIIQVEWPFICGVNGFSQETIRYEGNASECCACTADFFRFAEYTRLGEKVAKMAPVKNVGVYRDPKMYREDVLKKRLKKPYGHCARQDGRVRAFAELRNFSYDVIGPKFFTAKDLAQYRVVYIPEDEMMSDEEAKELLAYVKNGGSAIIEGATGCQGGDALATKDGAERCGKGVLALAKLGLKDGEVKPLGQGKILWIKECLTDRLATRTMDGSKAMRKVIADMGGVDPFTISALNGQECPFSGLDGILQAGPEGMFLGLYNEARERQSGVVTLRQGEDALATKAATCQGEDALATKESAGCCSNGAERCGKGVPALADGKSTHHCSPSPPPPTSTSLFVLDVKNGTRVPLTNNTFVVSAEAMQTSYYLIGDDAFTAIPSVRACVSEGPLARSANPQARHDTFEDVSAFKPVVGVEFVNIGRDGKPVSIRRSVDAKYDVRTITAADFDEKACRKGIAEAKYVNIVDQSPKDSDVLFESCGAELKEMLRRGGGIVFTRSPTGPAAQKFLREIGVFDPNPSAEKGIGDGWAKWCGPADHPIVSASSFFQYGRVFHAWDHEKQISLFMPKNDGEGYSGLVVQEKVLGAGSVFFNENQRSFTDFYEAKEYSAILLSLLTGVKPEDHAAKVTIRNGGLGDVWTK